MGEFDRDLIGDKSWSEVITNAELVLTLDDEDLYFEDRSLSLSRSLSRSLSLSRSFLDDEEELSQFRVASSSSIF